MHEKDRNLWHKKFLLTGAIWVIGTVPLVNAAISDNSGAALQLFSYYGTNNPKINGNITDGTSNAGSAIEGTNNDEWKNAAVRKIRLKNIDYSDSIDATLYFTNDSTNLYVAVSTSMGNSSNGTYIALYFDQGIGGGNHDGILQGNASTRGEYYAKVYPNKALTSQFEDGSFNGTAWAANAAPVGTGVGVNVGTSFNQAEFKIPFRSNPAASATNSYLSVSNGQELGFYIVCYSQGGNKTYVWTAGNESLTNPQTAPGWAELRLGVSASFMTFYATANVNGNPIIDGDISTDDAWRGSYRRDITLSNFNGTTIPATVYATQDATNNFLYIGIKVNDTTRNNPGDNCAIYQEQANVEEATTRDYLLNSHDNALIATEAGVTHQYWNVNQWTTSASVTQSGLGKWYSASNNYQYEFKVDYNAGVQALDATDNSFLGFLIKYHDAASNSDFYWNYSVNATSITTDQNTQAYTAIGEANIQLGAPYAQVVFPEDGSNVEGIVNLRVLAKNYNGSPVDYVQFYRKGTPATKFTCTRIGATDEWAGTFDVSSLANGPDTLVVETRGNGITLERLVNIVVSNSTGTAIRPTISLTSPAPGSTINGTQLIIFSAATASGSITATEISIDGVDFISTTTATTHNFATSSMAEGSHTIQLRATNSSGLSTTTQVITFVVSNMPIVNLLLPKSDTLLSGITAIQFHDSSIAPATISKKEIWIDGSKLDTSSTASTYIWNTTLMNDGQHTIQVRVTDNQNKVGMSEIVSITIYNSPVITITSPTKDTILSGLDTIAFSVIFPEGVTSDTTEINFDGKSNWQPTSTPLSYFWKTTDFTDGSHTIQIRARGTNGKTGFSQIAHIQINNSPVIDSIKAPIAGQTLKKDIQVVFAYSNTSPIVSRLISIDGGNWLPTQTDSSAVIQSSTLKDGSHTVAVKIIDYKGRSGISSQRLFIVDNTPPLTSDPNVKISAKTQYAKTFDSVLITVLVKDLLVGLDKDSGVVLQSNGMYGSVKVMSDSGKNGDAVAFDNVFTSKVKLIDTVSEISYTIITKDSLQNTKTLTSLIKLDNAPPRVAFTLTPRPESAQSQTYFDKLIMKGTYSDKGGSGISRVFISVTNDSGSAVNNSPVVLAPEDSVFSSIVMLVPGKNRIMLHATDAAGNMDSSMTAVTYYEPKQTVAVGRSGSNVKSPDGARVTIPADALISTVEVTITKVDPVKEPKPLNSSVKLLNVCHEFGPDGIVFRMPVALTLCYTDADLDKNQDGIKDVNPLNLSIVFWDGKTWRIAGKPVVDTTNRSVQVMVNHFTMFDLAEVKQTLSTDLVTYWSSNPVKSTEGAYFTYSVPSAGNVGLWIYDMAGNPVVQLIKTKTPVNAGQQSPVKWSGSNVSEHFAGAGMYVYVFTYTDDTGKTTVIRKPIGLLR
jgi:hypothetical protein